MEVSSEKKIVDVNDCIYKGQKVSISSLSISDTDLSTLMAGTSITLDGETVFPIIYAHLAGTARRVKRLKK